MDSVVTVAEHPFFLAEAHYSPKGSNPREYAGRKQTWLFFAVFYIMTVMRSKASPSRQDEGRGEKTTTIGLTVIGEKGSSEISAGKGTNALTPVISAMDRRSFFKKILRSSLAMPADADAIFNNGVVFFSGTYHDCMKEQKYLVGKREQGR